MTTRSQVSVESFEYTYLFTARFITNLTQCILQYATAIRSSIIASGNWMRAASSLPGAQHSGEWKVYIPGLFSNTNYTLVLQNPTRACRALFQGLGWPVRQSLQAVCPGKIESSARWFSHRTLIDCLLVYSLHAFNMHLTLRRAITNNILTSTLTWRI